MPATVNDAYHLLRMALKCPDPVIFIEHKGLYVRKGEMDVDKPDGPWGQSIIRREGNDVSIVTYSKMVFEVSRCGGDLGAKRRFGGGGRRSLPQPS